MQFDQIRFYERMQKLESIYYAGLVFASYITTWTIMGEYTMGCRVMERMPSHALENLFTQYEAIAWSALLRTAVITDSILPQ